MRLNVFYNANPHGGEMRVVIHAMEKPLRSKIKKAAPEKVHKDDFLCHNAPAADIK